MKVLIIEDEKIAATHLVEILKDTAENPEIVAALDSVSRSVHWLQQHQPDLIFMDIHLADDNAFSIFEQTEVKAPVIFTTAYDHYAIRAFKLNSIDYLLKPINKEEVEQALAKYRHMHSFRHADITTLLQAFRAPRPEYQQRFIVSTGSRIRSVETNQIAYFYAKDRYVMLVTTTGDSYITDYTLDHLETVLEPIRFFRINRAMMIGFGAIKHMHTYTKSRIKIELHPDPGFEVIVSIDRSGHFRKWLNR